LQKGFRTFQKPSQTERVASPFGRGGSRRLTERLGSPSGRAVAVRRLRGYPSGGGGSHRLTERVASLSEASLQSTLSVSHSLDSSPKGGASCDSDRKPNVEVSFLRSKKTEGVIASLSEGGGPRSGGRSPFYRLSVAHFRRAFAERPYGYHCPPLVHAHSSPHRRAVSPHRSLHSLRKLAHKFSSSRRRTIEHN